VHSAHERRRVAARRSAADRPWPLWWHGSAPGQGAVLRPRGHCGGAQGGRHRGLTAAAHILPPVVGWRRRGMTPVAHRNHAEEEEEEEQEPAPAAAAVPSQP
jgi:hypothetical protein